LVVGRGDGMGGSTDAGPGWISIDVMTLERPLRVGTYIGTCFPTLRRVELYKREGKERNGLVVDR